MIVTIEKAGERWMYEVATDDGNLARSIAFEHAATIHYVTGHNERHGGPILYRCRNRKVVPDKVPKSRQKAMKEQVFYTSNSDAFNVKVDS